MNVVFFVFKRPQHTARVFAEIARVQPKNLFVVADGPRRAEDKEACNEVRGIVDNVTWPCCVRRNYAEINLGCGRRIVSGLDWVFSHVSEAIVLEDDCLPDPSFFSFCAALLARFRNDERIGQIGGVSYYRGRSEASYYFSRYALIWGWATWARAWRTFDFRMGDWRRQRDVGLARRATLTRGAGRHFERLWDQTHAAGERASVWGAQWVYANMKAGRMSVQPTVNLVSNTGFDDSGTNTAKEQGGRVGNRPRMRIDAELVHPTVFRPDDRTDVYTERLLFQSPSGIQRFIQERVVNPYWYGTQLRRVPVVGRVWARYRAGRVVRRAGAPPCVGEHGEGRCV